MRERCECFMSVLKQMRYEWIATTDWIYQVCPNKYHFIFLMVGTILLYGHLIERSSKATGFSLQQGLYNFVFSSALKLSLGVFLHKKSMLFNHQLDFVTHWLRWWNNGNKRLYEPMRRKHKLLLNYVRGSYERFGIFKW